MKIAHIALWSNDIEKLRDFYTKYFNGSSHGIYTNHAKGFASCFMHFDNDVSLEIMQRTDICEIYNKEHIGLAHIAFKLPMPDDVNRMIKRLRADGHMIKSEPRITGDGYYEGVISDPEGNIVEITSYPEAEITPTETPPYDLLLEADPDKSKVDEYLKRSDCFIATVGKTVAGVIVVQTQGNVAEIMNLAVRQAFRRRGIAKQLLRHISGEWNRKNKIKVLRVCTGLSSAAPIMLYQHEGFELRSVDFDYFTRNYAEPIWENGIQCRHRLIMEKILG